MDCMIETKNVTRSFPVAGEEDIQVLKGISIEVPRGEFVILRGRSGSGKTTLMNILGALDAPTSGQVFLDGQETGTLDEKKRGLLRRAKIGFVFQSVALVPTMDAYENVEFALRLARYQGDRRKRAEECLHMVGLGGRMHHMPQQMSGGEQQRVAIAIALANDPKLLLADEPTGSVDVHTGSYILDVFRELNRSLGLTIVIVTHDRQLSKKVNRVVAIRDGKTSTEFIVRQNLVENLDAVAEFEDPHDEYAVLDRAGRLQIPREMLEELGVEGNRVRLLLEEGRIVIQAPPKEEEAS